MLEDSPVAETLIKYIVQKGAFSGAMQDLLGALTMTRKTGTHRADWPQTPRSLSTKLRHLAPHLRMMGIEVEFLRIEPHRIVRISIAAEEDQPLIDLVRPTFRQRARLFLQRFASAEDSDYWDQSSSRAGQEKLENSNNSS